MAALLLAWRLCAPHTSHTGPDRTQRLLAASNRCDRRRARRVLLHQAATAKHVGHETFTTGEASIVLNKCMEIYKACHG
ncbi:jg14405 [Pararge aegeria aegeria]|uniref:Jg14405 protein n=1 Tax=Pararge aegeria aegeria TaxID=348720 RepID=A0A8S4RZ57_9NEOP|nr:jg14405 [Pararge aegeria aegeria]